MPLFAFELDRVEDIRPWGEPGEENLSWFALTHGAFRMIVGDQVLFRYTDAVLSRWNSSIQDVDYQIASLARDILGSVAPGVTALPKAIERLAADRELLTRLLNSATIDGEDLTGEEIWHRAWRWLGERSPWTGYFVAHPIIRFARVGNDIHIQWDNRGRVIDGMPAWAAQLGVHALPVADFLGESRDFADRLLGAMDARITGIASGAMRPQVAVDVAFLRQQHENWRVEFDSYFARRAPDVPWDETVSALRKVAARAGARLAE